MFKETICELNHVSTELIVNTVKWEMLEKRKTLSFQLQRTASSQGWGF